MPESPRSPLSLSTANPNGDFVPIRLGREHHADAAARLSGLPPRERGVSKRSSLTFEQQGIPLDYVWGTMDHPGGNPRGRVRHVCLMVPGSGRTGMVFMSGVEHSGLIGPVEGQLGELTSLVRAATAWVQASMHDRIHLVQALPEAGDHHTMEVCKRAGYLCVGELQYLEGPLLAITDESAGQAPMAGGGDRAAPLDAWPEGISVRLVMPGQSGWMHDEPLLREALERSYEQTLDCPELCGLRDTSDVLESHRLAGEYDPKLWHLIFKHERPVGCAIYTPHPHVGTMELVYLGLAPEVRGIGLGSTLLKLGIRAARERGATTLTCAVDARNLPAIALYSRIGMRTTARRIAFIAPTRKGLREHAI